ncbi:MAG: bifunctional 5,10-methylenetetrahydrofolate dehydrogenase/5,10-methenyltetrahydrofolate cyclohydrolase [Bacteroidales bacterium]|jgi:methylenetetrahydrofolate dehydrogenase (NADP+)/methenyltetrahydrofolate cyclohydrolase|nr:bifunctional 5,10-methylenetetrahydrofolate dehydrogenase/5,10-methenyltetrahydrofolate cyclohydrolase [Bacteroidales bacterium]
MSATIIDGTGIANLIYQEIAEEVKLLLDAGRPAPHLAAMVIGNDGASKSYIESIRKRSQQTGITHSIYQLPETAKKEDVIETLRFINQDAEIDGFILQMPLPKHIPADEIIACMNPDKDIDCFTAINNGKLFLGEDTLFPATPWGTIELLKRSGISVSGQNCVVVGRSNIVGKPLALLLARNHPDANATVTLCHSRTRDLQRVCAEADILFVAIGKPEMITHEYVKEGAVVIDIGIHRLPDATLEKGYRLCGDVKYDEVAERASWITPVPGGVGPMTMACLLINTLKAYKGKEKNL